MTRDHTEPLARVHAKAEALGLTLHRLPLDTTLPPLRYRLTDQHGRIVYSSTWLHSTESYLDALPHDTRLELDWSTD